jgi:hypothetical protein
VRTVALEEPSRKWTGAPRTLWRTWGTRQFLWGPARVKTPRGCSSEQQKLQCFALLGEAAEEAGFFPRRSMVRVGDAQRKLLQNGIELCRGLEVDRLAQIV